MATLDELNEKWKTLITTNFRPSSWADIENNWTKGKDAILNDPYFLTLKDLPEDKKKEALNSVAKLYQEGTTKEADNNMSYVGYSINEYKPELNLIYWSF